MLRCVTNSQGFDIETLRANTAGMVMRSGSVSTKLPMTKSRGFSSMAQSPMSSQVDIQPKVLENKMADSQEFYKLSDGFKRIFANDKKVSDSLDDKDRKMIIPIAGYAGHKRGDRSQNFFGKSYRECAIQSKRF